MSSYLFCLHTSIEIFSASSSAVVMSPFLLRTLSFFTDDFDAGYSSLSTKFQAAEEVT